MYESAKKTNDRRKILLIAITFTLPCYCLGIFSWQYTPPSAFSTTATLTMTIHPFEKTDEASTERPTLAPVATNTFPPTSLPSETPLPTDTFTPLPTWTTEPSATNTQFIFETPTDLPGIILTNTPNP